MKQLRYTGYAAFFVNGMLAVMTGAIITYLVRDYGISYGRAGRLVAAQSIGNLIMVLVSGFVIQALGRKRTLLVVPLLFAIGFGGIAFTGNVPVLFVLFTMTGLGWGLCNNILNIIMMEDENSGISFLYTCYAIGSFMGPFLVVRIIAFGWSWKAAVLIVAVASLCLLPGFATAKCKALETKGGKKEKLTKADFVFFREPRYYVCMVLYFGYIGVEVAINSWMITYLTRTGLLTQSVAETSFSVFWLIIILVRILVGKFLKKIKREYLLLAQWIGFGLAMTSLLLAGNEIPAIAFLAVSAVFMAAISPVNAENADEYIKGKGISGGIMFAVGCVGSTILPMVVGNLTDSFGIRTGMKVVVGVIYFIIFVCGINIIMKKKNAVQ